MLNILGDPLSIIIYFAGLVTAITVHEFAHAFAADRLGDPTPRLQGRLTLNPLAHLDPLGTLMLLLVRFGWGKPVQFDPFNLRNPRRDSAIISIAGPVSNLLLALLASIISRILPFSSVSSIVSILLTSLISMNVVLAIFNLIPIHPLDGFKIVGGLLSNEKAREWYALERYGMFFLLLLVFPLFGGTSPIHYLISPPIDFLLRLLIPTRSIFI